MNGLVPWEALEELVEPSLYLKPGRGPRVKCQKQLEEPGE